jgi:hypothetical protein
MMNPKPLVALNHLTVPVAIAVIPYRNRAPSRGIFRHQGLLNVLKSIRWGKHSKPDQGGSVCG